MTEPLELPGMFPVIPAELGIDPLLAALLQAAAFLDLGEDDVVDPDAAVSVLEHVGLYASRLSPEQIDALQEQLERIVEYGESQGWPEEIVEFTLRFLYHCGVGGDPEEQGDDDE